MKKKLSMVLAMLMLMLCLPVSVGAVSASGEVTIQTELFSGFDITLPESLAEKYRWEEIGFEGTNTINFYDRGLYDATDETAISAQSRGYRFSISQYSYDSDYRRGVGDLAPSEMFQPTGNQIAAFYRRDGVSQQPMILSVGYTIDVPASVEQDALEIVNCMTPKSDVHMENVDVNPWNLKFANFLLNGQFRTVGQEYFDKVEIQACLYNVVGSDYPEFIITNGASGYAALAYVYAFSVDGQVEYLRTATTEELNAMPLQPFTAIRGGWGDFLEACGYQIEYLPAQVSSADWLGTYRYDDGNQGELYIVKESDDSEVRGVYVYCRADGEYDSRDFVWSKEDSSTASEPFYSSGSARIFHYLKGDRIVSDYPNGWWSDRDYVRVSDVEHSYLEEVKTAIPVSYAGATVDFKESLFEKSACVYDNELATLGAILSCAVEKSEQDIVDLLQTIEVDDYDLQNFGGNESFAFAVAHKEMRLNGEDAVVLFVIARGTQTFAETVLDAMPAKDPFFNYKAYDYAYKFYEKINNDGISEYIRKYPELLDKPLKVFVTGHSLGGAGANLVAANFTLYEWWGNYLSNEDVFAYTYGAIDSIDVKTPVVDGYENIHNVYNFYDTFGPNGWILFTTSGNSGEGKFGHNDKFGHPYTTGPLTEMNNHLIENYLSSIVQGEVSCKSPFSKWDANCPIDVEVLRDGMVVGRIVDNQVDEDLMVANPEVALMVVEDSKHVGVFGNSDGYSLRITATDDGEMSVSTVSFDDAGESYGVAEYSNVEIKNGQAFSMELPAAASAGSDPQAPELLLMDGDRISGKVNPDGSISPVNGAGNVLQLALLAAIVLVGVLIAFLGGRKMKEIKQLTFPIASIFTVILVFGLLSNLQELRFGSGWMDNKIGYRMVVEFGGTYSVLHILYQVLLIGSMILLAVLLFIRKRNSLLAGALAIQALLPAFTLMSFLLNCGSRGFFDVYEYELHFGPMMWAIGICGCYVLEILCYLLLTFMTIMPCAGDGEHKRGLHKLWFLPGILSIFIAFAHLVGNIYFMRSDLYCLSVLFLIPMAFLMGWWLTHPYKKESPVYQMPVAQSYGQPFYQSVGTFDAAQKVICSGCGRELLPDEIFCAVCGTRRPEPSRAEPDTANQKFFCSGCGQELLPDENFCSVCGKQRTPPAQGAQPVFQQQVNPQMSYVQDAPSGGMTALGFFVPIVGLILYLVWKDQTPLKAHSAGKGALIGVIVWTALSIILAILAYVIPLLLILI